MIAEEKQVVRKHTKSLSSFNNLWLWIMLYILVQQAIRCDPYLYTLMVVFWNNEEFKLLELLEPA